MNTNTEKINLEYFHTLTKKDKLNIIKRMIYNFAERINKYEVAYLEEYKNGFKCILPQRCPLFDGPHTLHDRYFWHNWFKKNTDIHNIPGRYITLASTGNGLVFKKINLDLSSNYID